MSSEPAADEPRLWLPLAEAADAHVAHVGGKARALGVLSRAGLPIPDGVVLTTQAYRAFVAGDGLDARIRYEVARKRPSEARWEELWDAYQRIRAAIIAAPMDAGLETAIREAIARVGSHPLAVRSSSPHEDAEDRSFAGLHESVIGPVGERAALDAIREVWASLWSDRAMLYRDETKQPGGAAMAVVIQRLASSERSGVAFSISPVDPGVGVLEAVWGLGEGLVSGAVEPDRWDVERATGAVVRHVPPASRDVRLVRAERRLAEEPLPAPIADTAPLTSSDVSDVWKLVLAAERAFGSPQDTEWTWDDDAPLLTQSRPITTGIPDDDRAWYLTLTPSLERLEDARVRIETELLPGMLDDAASLAAVDVTGLSPAELAVHAERAVAAVERARRAYRDELIAFAHGARLFGSFYNAEVRPDDAYEFTSLLVRDSAGQRARGELLSRLGIAWEPPPDRDAQLASETSGFLERFEGERRTFAEKLLRLGRASWALRDDDNLYLDLVEREAARARAEVCARSASSALRPELSAAHARLDSLEAGSLDSNRPAASESGGAAVEGAPRQLIGQPAGPGLARGPARVVRSRADLEAVRPGDILVIDALEPDTAAYASRAAGIVERRGGMLVHGAIVAREWGLACVTGVPDATSVIAEGEPLVVDGFLGIVTRASV